MSLTPRLDHHHLLPSLPDVAMDPCVQEGKGAPERGEESGKE